MTCRIIVVFAILASVCFIGTARADDGWQTLCDGKTLAGWHAVGDGKWTVEDGTFVGRANNEKLYGLLVSDRQFSDFTVRFKFKCASGDSGFYIRTIIKEPEKAHGLQVQVGRLRSGAGGVYESYGRGWMSKPTNEAEASFLKEDDWNDMVIDAWGGDIKVYVNGTLSAEIKGDTSRPTGHLALQMHAGCVMDVRFKDIEIRERKSDE